ncbi:Bacteriocin class II with double-glycine leader peptide [Lactobacillus bombicola]|uniref:Bacteriocin class II with double-glycine leader peptide n=1 Tax=Lactobacillus bombicola TaxID=1505723 RepID=A0A1I1R7D4_9LACO|nr:Blp family class II bacteriocin [Lactobacillus bombicola]MCO6528117.1 Blp family class II bacteriocin [Lactobacillus sp.]SFD30251.1 Bacteriocin class II with double-glycine leader peptide [Lactobacillus bombicola]
MEVTTLSDKDLVTIVGGRRNTWKENVEGAVKAISKGAGLGVAVCGPECALLGAEFE